MFTLDNVSSTELQKGQDPSGMGRWTFLTILKKITLEQLSSPCIDHVKAR